jgi:hypothetical protein
MKKLVILTGKSGDLCNRLFRFARFYCAKPPEICLMDLTLYQFVYLFSPGNFLWRVQFWVLRLLNNARFQKLVTFLKRLPFVEKLDPPAYRPGESDQALSKFYQRLIDSKSRIILVEDNTYFMLADVEQGGSHEKLKDIFTLKTRYSNEAKSLMKRKQVDATLIGVHMRRRDYRTFAGGKYYFDNQEYCDRLKSLSSESGNPQKLIFLLICEESLELKDFDAVDTLSFGQSSIGLDQALLKECDYLVGPASTFSGWVSFLHEIPRAEIIKSKQTLGWKDFEKVSCNYIAGMEIHPPAPVRR